MSRVELYREKDTHGWDDFGQPVVTSRGGWRWRFVKNGRNMGDSGQAYSRRIDCLKGAATVLGGMTLGPFVYRRELHMQPGSDGVPVMDTVSLWIPVHDLTKGV